jgi:hypothetical protein
MPVSSSRSRDAPARLEGGVGTSENMKGNQSNQNAILKQRSEINILRSIEQEFRKLSFT